MIKKKWVLSIELKTSYNRKKIYFLTVILTDFWDAL